jgi:hypothetical protein
MLQVKLTRVLTIVTVCSGLAVASTAPAAPKLFPARVALGQWAVVTSRNKEQKFCQAGFVAQTFI